MRAPARALLELARAHGVQAGYVDTTGRRRMADAEALLAVLAALGEPLEHPEAAAGALERRRAARDDRPVEPVLVAWDGRLRPVPLRLGPRPGARIRARLRFESGQERAWAVATDDLRGSDGVARLRVDGALPIGRHELSVEIGRRSGTAAILSAPRRVRAADGPREWGVFLPVHALVTERDWGIGDFTGLEELADLVRGLGGGMVATLPLLAGFAGEASPYRPVSRLFWNEVYLDVDRVPGIERAAARRVLRSASFGRELESLRSSELVDHGRALALKRRVLEPIASSSDAEPRGLPPIPTRASGARGLREVPGGRRAARARVAPVAVAPARGVDRARRRGSRGRRLPPVRAVGRRGADRRAGAALG